MVTAAKLVRRFNHQEFEQMEREGFFCGRKAFLVEGIVFVETENGLVPHKWKRSEYYRMGELGFFNGQRVELVDGEVIVMSPQGAHHYWTIDRVARILGRVFGEGFWVRIQAPLRLETGSEPEPDIAIVTGLPNDYLDEHPSTAVLVIEVSDTSLAYDRTEKARVYARAGVPEYWIVNLLDRQLEVYRKPQVLDVQQNYGYAEVKIFKANEFVSPLSKPEAKIPVSDLLPAR